MNAAAGAGLRCTVCGGSAWRDTPVLWPALVAAWQLAPHEQAYIDLQQGRACTGCGANLRSVALARAILDAQGHPGPLRDFVTSDAASRLQVLEINAAGMLHNALRRMPGHLLASWPEVDMRALPHGDGRFDLVVHSDSLEHVANPVRALAECRRVLRPGGALCFTTPIVVGRMTRDRAGLPPSHHGNPGTAADDYQVQTEYGADAWTQLMLAGFERIGITAVQYPAALALTAWR
jgi:SAM-dependent methyltransferase